MSKTGSNNKSSTSQNVHDGGEGNSTKKQSKNRGKKRKRQASDSSNEYEDILPENSLEMEKSLHASAIKNNLDDVSVRKILKKVVTNDHVLALVKLREEEEESSPEENSLRPKLTRAKVKELMKVSPITGAWNLENMELIPIKHIPVKTRPEVKALIAQELPDDEDDDEYEPTHDDVPSDDDHVLESCSDADSQPRTPATPRSQHATSPKLVQDGPFKVPQELPTPARRKLNLEEDATIALRTRSKLSLSATSIEHIESTFVPPDDLPMPAVDDLWNQFLNECLNPAATSARHEDDDETDPEYNVAADQDAHDEDEEALGNSIIKISKKELNDLVTELFNIMPEVAAEDALADNLASSVLTEHSQADVNATRWEGKQEPISDDEKRERLVDKITFEKKGYTRLSIGKSEPGEPHVQDGKLGEQQDASVTKKATGPIAPEAKGKAAKEKNGNKRESSSVNMCIEEQEEAPGSLARAPALLRRHLRSAGSTHSLEIQVAPTVTILPEQILILQQQIRQHVQLATTNYLQLYVHPIHWSHGPTYKEYLETLTKLVEKNPKSVVNVCNLKPAMELVETWEKTVSDNTPENAAMVAFIQSEAERCRRRMSNNNMYVGEFHETFKRVVANSSVVLYPHLLPAMPYRAESCRRFSYMRAEDELIAIGLDQFWQYVEDNPSIFKPLIKPHERKRWGFSVTVPLMVKHMFPWMPVRVMVGHIQHVKKNGDKDNPICKFFESREVTPVQHRLLGYNPQLTLYEQPEQEIPRLWIRYLAKTSKRFRTYLHRRTNVTGIAPTGVPIEMGKAVTEPTKAPLPIDFTKEIVSNRANIKVHLPKPQLADKFDVQITPNEPRLESNTVIANLQLGTSSNQPADNLEKPVTSESRIQIQPNALVATNMYKMVETSTGTFLVPLADVSTVNTNMAPITTPAVAPTVTVNRESSTRPLSSEHCNCCVLLRRICKWQTVITDYFRPEKSVKSCYCDNIKHPRVSNKLKLLVNNYRNRSQCNLRSLERMLNMKYGKKCDKVDGDNEIDSNSCDVDDLAFVTSFQLRLITRTNIARNTYIKKRVNTLFSHFDVDSGDPAVLANELYKAFEVELVDMYKEFLGFLTPEQADRMDVFKDYFVRTSAEDLRRKINEQVQDTAARSHMLSHLHTVFLDNVATACELCCSLLQPMEKYPKLAEYVFSLFPHRRVKSPKEKETPPAPEAMQETRVEDAPTDNNNTPAAMDCEADHSSSGEDIESAADENVPEHSRPESVKAVVVTDPSSENIENHQIDTIKTENKDLDQDSSSNASMLIVFEDESIKHEGLEWKREEDKLILELLKEQITPEERKDKTIIEILTEKNVFEMISESLTHKSLDEVHNRVLYLLQMLVLGEK